MKRFILLFTVLAFTLACASKENLKDNQDLGQNNILTDIQSGIEQLRISNDYLLQPGDLLEVKVYMEENMDRTLRISANGTITFPLVGNIRVGGMSVAAAENALSKELKRYIKNPQISMLIQEYGNKTVYILGQVQKPSAVEIPPEKPLTVLEAITSVGGFTDIAAPSKVKVLRMDNGNQKAIDVDITQITKYGNKSLDINLMPGDVVFVPQSIF